MRPGLPLIVLALYIGVWLGAFLAATRAAHPCSEVVGVGTLVLLVVMPMMAAAAAPCFLPPQLVRAGVSR